MEKKSRKMMLEANKNLISGNLVTSEEKYIITYCKEKTRQTRMGKHLPGRITLVPDMEGR